MHLRRIAVATLAGLLLSACSDDPPDPQATPTPTASSSPTPTETAQPSAQPQTAEDFIANWVHLQNEMLSSGETADYAVVTRGCQTCQALVQQVERIYAAGGWIKGGDWTVVSTEVVGRQGSVVVMRVELQTVTSKFRESPSAEIQTSPGGTPTARVELSKRGPTWNLDDFGQEA